MWKRLFNRVTLIRVLVLFCLAVFFLFVFSRSVILGILLFVLFLYLRHLICFVPPQGACYLWLGIPGSGKTTCAAYIALMAHRMNIRCFSNVPISGTYRYSWKDDFGHYDQSNSIVICDEAGVELNGRNWKANFDDASLDCIKKFRHRKMTLHFFSQSSDEDPIVRNLSMTTYVVTKPLLPKFVKIRQIGQSIDINDQTKKRDVCEYWKPFSTQFVWCPPAWKLFDTFECRPLPKKRWQKW